MSHSHEPEAPQEVESVEELEVEEQETTGKTGKKRTKRPPRVKLALGMQYINDPSYWAWTDEELKALDGTAEDMLGVIVARFEAQEPGLLVEAHGIIHDKDTLRRYDLDKQQYVGELKPRHFHFIVEFSRQVPLKAVAALIGVEEQFIEKPKSGPYTKPNGLAYLIHAKDSDKFQYAPEEVASYGATSYLHYYSLNKAEWEQGQDTKTVKTDRELRDWLHLRLLDGRVHKEELLDNPVWRRVYSKNVTLFDNALKICISARMQEAARKLKNGDFGTSFIYVQGQPGVGKTVFVKALMEKLIAKAAEGGEHWSWYATGATNAMDEYAGQEIIWMDDVRPDKVQPEEWLRLLDPYNSNTASARYHNKENVAPRYVIMSVYMDVAEFFGYYSKVRDLRGEPAPVAEALDQFIRRIAANVRLYRAVVGEGQEVLAYELRQPVQTTHGYEMRVTYDRLTDKGVLKALTHETRALSMKDLDAGDDDVDLSLDDDDVIDEGEASTGITVADDLFPYVHLRGEYLQGAPTDWEFALLYLVNEHIRLFSKASSVGGFVPPHARLVMEAYAIDIRLAMAVLDSYAYRHDVYPMKSTCLTVCGIEPYQVMNWEAFHEHHGIPYEATPGDKRTERYAGLVPDGLSVEKSDFMSSAGVEAYFSETRKSQADTERLLGFTFPERWYPDSERAREALRSHRLDNTSAMEEAYCGPMEPAPWESLVDLKAPEPHGVAPDNDDW